MRMVNRVAAVVGVVAAVVLASAADCRDIALKRARFDPASGRPNLPAELTRTPVPGQADYFIVQFSGPITERAKQSLLKVGVEIIEYVPEFAFVVRATQEQIAEARKLSFVSWADPYHPAYAISPRLNGKSGNVRVSVLLFPGEQTESVLNEAKSVGAALHSAGAESRGEKIDLSVPTRGLSRIAASRGVAWIEPYVEPKLTNDVASGLMSVPQAWSDAGAHGAGEIVAVCDTGLDTGSTSTISADFAGRIVATYGLGRKNKWDDPNGHGTHVAGSVLGSGVLSGSDPATHSYVGSFAGVAPEARIVFQSVLDNAGTLRGLPSDLNDLFLPPYNDGARIHTNSWGAAVAGVYTLDARNVDVFTWEHPDMLVLCSAGNSAKDADSNGVVDTGSVHSPATAKNCIAVGACESYRLSGGAQGTYGGYWPADFPAAPISGDKVSNNSSGLAAFSGRGPTEDGRIKPDVVTPGTNVISCRSHVVGAGTLWGVYNTHYVYGGGTSMSTPLAAGAAAIVRGYYRKVRGHTPSAALVKATLINGAAELSPGQYGVDAHREIPSPRPNNAEGWGRVDVAYSLAPPPARKTEFVDEPTGLSTGGSLSYTYYVSGSGSPLRVTLAWTDYPAAAYASSALVNDLDLVVVLPDGTSVQGNGNPDRVNNVEGVDISSPPTGNYTVHVSGYNVPFGPQPYALVVSGETGLPLPAAEITSPPDGSFVDGPVTLIGTASGDDFQQYVLEYGVGTAPSTWTQIGSARTDPVTAAPLGVWDPRELPEGDYTIRLSVTGAGGTSESQVVVHLLRTSVAGAKSLPDGQPVTLTGKVVTASPADFRGRMYVQDIDGVSGIRVELGSAQIEAPMGALVTVTGTISTIEGERAITNPTVVVTAPAR